MINKMTIVERLGQNPILHYLMDSTPRVAFIVATNDEMVG